MQKKIMFVALIIFVVFVMGVMGVRTLKIYRNDRDEVSRQEVARISGIICVGDSLTYGAGGDGMGYPDYLFKDLDMDGYIIPVYNLGVGGENTVTIAARIGAIPLKVESFTVPAGIESIEINFKVSENGQFITPLRQASPNNNGINPCVINGIEGSISIEQETYSSAEYQYYFTRLQAGEEQFIEDDSVVETFASNNPNYVDGIFVVFIGANGGYDDIDDLIKQQQAILDVQRNNADKYLILGISTGTYAERAELEAEMLRIYGDKYINVRELLSDEEVLAKAGVYISTSDREQMKMGAIPGCVRSDETHFNSVGYEILEQAIYKRMTDLGYFDEVSNIADDFNSRWGFFHKLEILLR